MIFDRLKTIRVRAAEDSATNGGGPFASRATDLGDGGSRAARFANQRSGAGSFADKDLGGMFVARRMERAFAETLYQMSWAARRMIDLPVNDMFVRGRAWSADGDGAAIKAMETAERDLKVMQRLANGMKAGRLFGTSLVVICPSDGDFESELRPEDVVEGGIANLWVVDRWAASVESWRTDPTLPRCFEPFMYRISGRIFGSPTPSQEIYSKPTTSQNVSVNADRVIRFDGHDSPLTEGWTTGPWEREWGVSILTEAVDEILRDAGIHAGIGHLVQEASVWVHKIEGFRDALMGELGDGEVTPEMLASEANLLKSIYHAYFHDVSDEVSRVSVQFGGLWQLLNTQADRLAAIAGVPKTRFLGSSATGLNATGEGEARDWRITVAALQKSMLDPVLQRVDMMIARHAGLAEPPEYEWLPLGEESEREQAEVLKMRAEAITMLHAAPMIDEEEGRAIMSQDEWVGELGDWVPPPMPEPMPLAGGQGADRPSDPPAS